MRDPWLDWPDDLRRAGTALLRLALNEDLGDGDLTAHHFAESGQTLTVRLAAREPGILAGLPLFLKTFAAVLDREGGLDANAGLPAGLVVRDAREDGESFRAGELLVRLKAPARVLHSGERTALNFLQQLSAVATETARAVSLSSGPAVLDTRKTLPGYRALQKYAVRMGGGENHRQGLYDAVMVKDNHKEAAGGMAAVMEKVAALPEGFPVYVEVDTLDELGVILAHAAAGRVSRVLLDNFDPDQVREALALRMEAGGGPGFEISGGLKAADLADPRYAGVEAASLGGLTHSVRALDLALETEA